MVSPRIWKMTWAPYLRCWPRTVICWINENTTAPFVAVVAGTTPAAAVATAAERITGGVRRVGPVAALVARPRKWNWSHLILRSVRSEVGVETWVNEA